MTNNTIKERLSSLREAMQVNQIDFYLIPTSDFHNSEYVSDYFKTRTYFSGFTGSNGSLLVWQSGAGLWTDGRYFIQAEHELEGTGVDLFRMQEEGVPTIKEFLQQNMDSNQTLGFDGRVLSYIEAARFEEIELEVDNQQKALRERHGNESKINIKDMDIVEKIYKNRCELPCGKISVLEEAIAGKSAKEKLNDVREVLKKKNADTFLLSKLDDLMWLFNIRGCDVDYNPVALSYGYITSEKAYIFLQSNAVDTEVKHYLTSVGVELMEYHTIFDFMKKNSENQRILVDKRHVNYTLIKTLSADNYSIVYENNPTELLKAVKNKVELKNMEHVYLQDSLAVTRFIYWLKKNIGKMEITELSAAKHLEQLRREIPEFLDLSFPTIAGYNANAAMMHYEATEENYSVLKEQGLFLVDSGGQYLGGTTDVTRTIVLGELSEEWKKHYTYVAAGMLQLSNANWLFGCTGRNLDILARQPLWEIGLDYKCGTGHGVGYILNVHEGPQNLRWKFMEGMTEAVLEAGMDITNEPGVYIEGSHGIRIENVMVVQNGNKNEYGQFMHFDTLTFVPIDREAISIAYMTEKQRELLNQYHQQVYEKLSPLMSEEEKKWLEEVTRKI